MFTSMIIMGVVRNVRYLLSYLLYFFLQGFIILATLKCWTVKSCTKSRGVICSNSFFFFSSWWLVWFRSSYQKLFVIMSPSAMIMSLWFDSTIMSAMSMRGRSINSATVAKDCRCANMNTRTTSGPKTFYSITFFWVFFFRYWIASFLFIFSYLAHILY